MLIEVACSSSDDGSLNPEAGAGDLEQKAALQTPDGGKPPLSTKEKPPQGPEDRAAAEFAAILAQDVRPARIADILKEISAAPHPAGSAANAGLSRYLVQLFQELGYQVEEQHYEVLLPYPVETELEMVEPFAFAAALREPALSGDFDTTESAVHPPFLAYGADAEFQAAVIYANYGRIEDYRELSELGISVKGKIVLVRRGVIDAAAKSGLAESAGALGMVVYADPAEDGFPRGEVAPRGKYRPEGGASRGSTLRLALRAGDPGTPEQPSRARAEHLSYDQMETLCQIPSLSISAADAKPILESMKGPAVPTGWQGALPLTYHLGGKEVLLSLKVKCDYRLRKVTNVVALWPGLERSDERVLVGSHRDAWGHGAIAAGTGTAVMMEVARVLAERARAGSPPKRTLVFASWDASTFGGLGAAEWAEQERATLMAEAVAYIDLGNGVFGNTFRSRGTPSLATALGEVINSLSLGKLSSSTLEFHGAQSPDALAFQGHLCIPILNLEFGGSEGLRGSKYDTFRAAERFVDPGFKNCATLARIAAALVSRLALAPWIPYDFRRSGTAIAVATRQLAKRRPELDLSEFTELSLQIRTAGQRLDRARRTAALKLPPSNTVGALNKRLLAAERLLGLEGGNPLRPWYRHLLTAPDPDRSPAVELFPSLEDALRAADQDGAQREATRITTALRRFATHLEALALSFEGLVAPTKSSDDS